MKLRRTKQTVPFLGHPVCEKRKHNLKPQSLTNIGHKWPVCDSSCATFSFLAAQRIVNRGICYENVCPYMTVRNIRESRLNGLSYRNTFARYDRYSDVSSLSALNSVVLN